MDWPSVVIEEDPVEVWEDPGKVEDDPREAGEDPSEDGEDPVEVGKVSITVVIEEDPVEDGEDPSEVGEDTCSGVVGVKISVSNVAVDGLEPGVSGVDEWVPGGASHSDQLGVVLGSVGSKQYWVWDQSPILMYTHESFLENGQKHSFLTNLVFS